MIKKAAVINDLSGFGKCSLAASIAILSVMGIQPCPMPTAVLTNQSGYKNHYCADLTEVLTHYKDMWQLNGAQFDGIYSGYVASKEQIDIIADFIQSFRRSYTTVLVDPVMADDGILYGAYTAQSCRKVCSLAKCADIITPNLTEFCIISGTDFKELTKKSEDESYLDIISELAQRTVARDGQKIIVTGIKKDGFVHNGVFSKNDRYFTKSKIHGDSFSGTGDIFASIVCASVLNGTPLEAAAEKAAKFLEAATADTVKQPYERNDGINFEKFLCTLHKEETL